MRPFHLSTPLETDSFPTPAFFPDRTNHASSSAATFGPRKPGSLASHAAFQDLLARPPTYLDPTAPVVAPTKVIAPPPLIPVIPTLPPIIPPVPAYKPAARRPSSTDYTSDDDDYEEGAPRSAPLKRGRGSGGRASALSHEFVDTSSEEIGRASCRERVS